MSVERVVALPGFVVPTPYGEPVQSVVDLLRKFLLMAESGEMRAVSVAYVLMHPNATIDGEFVGDSGCTWALSAAHARVGRRINRLIDG